MANFFAKEKILWNHKRSRDFVKNLESMVIKRQFKCQIMAMSNITCLYATIVDILSLITLYCYQKHDDNNMT